MKKKHRHTLDCIVRKKDGVYECKVTGERPLDWWRRDSGQCCPHGLKVVYVDGAYVRNHWDSDFVQGGHGWRYRFIPKAEIWIDWHIPDQEVPFVLHHECLEVEKMRKHGMDYDRAHNCAKRSENKMRRLAWPGEGRGYHG